MKVKDALNEIINTYNQLLQLCYDALDPNADQGKRDKLRQAIAQYLKPEGDTDKDSASRD